MTLSEDRATVPAPSVAAYLTFHLIALQVGVSTLWPSDFCAAFFTDLEFTTKRLC